jgi:predicted ATPase
MTFQDPGRYLLTRRRFRSPAPGDACPAEPATRRAPRALRRILLTGGPGSGKSTAASFLAREFTDELWILPESATLLYRGGLPRAENDLGQQIAQRAIFTVQRSLEEASGLQHPARVQLCDRGTIDGAAYWPDGAEAFFRAMGTTHASELARYDAVIFMHTAALLPAGYERDLEVRTEDRGEAVELDRRMFELFSEHPRVISVESQGSFLDKLTVVRNAVAELVRTTSTAAPALVGVGGGGEGVQPAPLSSLMGLESVQHVLPAD